VRADRKMLFVERECALGGVLFLGGAAAAFVERLHPERLGDVGDGFGEAVQGGGAGIQAGGEFLPPGVEHRVDGIGRAGAKFFADPFDGGALAVVKERIGRAFDVAGGDAARGAAIRFKGSGHLRSISFATYDVWCDRWSSIIDDNDSYPDLW